MGIITPYWSHQSPTGMIEPTEKIIYTKDGLDFTILAWKQYAEITDGIETATIKVRNTAGGGMYPIDILTDTVNDYSMIGSVILPLGALWKHRIVWTDSSHDSGDLMMFLAETGYLNTLYINAPANREFHIDGTINWANPSADIYTLGDIRVKIVKGNDSVAGTRITVTPDGNNKVQIMIYNRSAFDGYTVNELGATTSITTDEISDIATYYKEKHMRVLDTDMGLDIYVALNPVTTETKGLMVKFFRDGNYHYVFFGMATDTFHDWLFQRRLLKVWASGVFRTIRDWRYVINADGSTPSFTTQTFNYYPFLPGRSWTFWSVGGRILQPITFKFYKDMDVFLLYFPESNGDQLESGAFPLSDTTTTKTVWAVKDYRLLEGLKFINHINFSGGGVEGMGPDGAFRHLLYGLTAAGHGKYRDDSDVWHDLPDFIGGMNYYRGDASYCISPEGSIRYFTRFRHWSGWFEANNNMTDVWGIATQLHIGPCKEFHSVDIIPAGAVTKPNQCVEFEFNGDIPSDGEAEAMFDLFEYPIGVEFVDGLVNLNAGTPATNLPWDMGYDGDGEPQIFESTPFVTTGPATDVTSTTATGHGNIINTGSDPTCDERGCEWGLVSGGPYPNDCVEAGAFGVGAFTCNLIDLPCNTIIYYRAKAHNSAGWSYGDEESFITDWCPCSEDLCVNYGIRLRWQDNATNEDNYYVERDDGGWHVIATLPANTTTYLDMNVECDVEYLYRVRAGNAFGYSNYLTLSSPITCECRFPSEVKQHIADAIKEWTFPYPFQFISVEKIKAGIISRIGETKTIKSRVISSLFSETRKVRGKIGLERFEETLSVKFPLIIKFTEICPIMGNIVKKFEETKVVKALVFIWFVDGARVYGETKSIEEDVLEELERIMESDN